MVDTNGALSQVLAEYDDSSLITLYTRGEELISQERNGEKSYYLYNGFDSVRMLTDSEGVATDTYTFDAFGNLVSSTGDTENSYLYRGEQYDSFTGLYYLRARYMNPSTGTFITMDEYAGSVFEPVSLHKYLYANANPVTYCDPTGYFTTSDMAATCSGISYLANTVVASCTSVMSLLKITLLSATIAAPFVMLFSDELCDILAGLLDGSETSASIGAGVAGNIVDNAIPDVLDDEAEQDIAEDDDDKRRDDGPIIFPENPYDFHPKGLTLISKPGSKNGGFVLWQDVSGVTIFRWDENINGEDGSHYHIPEVAVGKKPKDHTHYYPGYFVPEPYASIYF